MMYIIYITMLMYINYSPGTIGTSSESTSSAGALEDAARFLAIRMKIQNAGDVH
jgi:hypothetical protein